MEKSMPDNPFFIMLLATPCEFSSRWKWKVGDRAILLGDGREVLLINVQDETLEHPEAIVKYVFPYSNKFNIYEAEACDLVPIPDVRQLQKISDQGWRSFDEMCLYEYHSMRQYEKGDLTKEMLALAVYVRIKYRKEWHGGTWVRLCEDEGDSDI